uniref:P-type Zn(2+) transporter n=1 Tax=Candidatus Kentrum sp. FM TaxID=2126340 RepID=A0A450WC84_9GAMM|nr:MAG: Cu2+-exporting ATPase [Candidatus Kentron sp. FM]VFJ48988.1 MAG: Cu2+-exporting ATPase [Candidatus Kentron sp. FM]VFK14650.1 MAG: Cu2+-exporting ATPase [Candidatus Kentron sp. FM]
MFFMEIVVAASAVYLGKKYLAKKRKSRRISPVAHEANAPGKELSCTACEDEIGDRGKQANHYLKASSVALGLTALSRLFYPALVPVGLLAIVYSAFPFYESGFRAFFKTRRIEVGILDVILVTGMLATGHLFVSAATIWLLSLSEKLLIETENDSRRKLVDVFSEQVRTVWVRTKGVELEIPFEELKVGDTVVVNAGESIPVDGMVVDGVATVDQHALTGESRPVERTLEDKVLASTILLSGRLGIRVERTGQDTIAARIGNILNNTADFTASVQARGMETANAYTPPTLALGAITLPILGPNAAMTILLSGLGYNMRLVSPISVLNYLKILSGEGILIKDGRALEQLGRVDTVVFDKTGTLTLDRPHVGNIHIRAGSGISEHALLRYAASAEYRQTHPIAMAILDAARQREIDLPPIGEAAYEIGYGIRVKVDGVLVRVGSTRFMEMEGIPIPTEMRELQEQGLEEGYSLICVAIDGKLGGMLELHPTLRPEVKGILHGLKQRGISLYIISGDHERPTRRLATELGIDHYFAETLPENKADLIGQLQREGKYVCFVGDGINDSIALKKANVSISIKGATTAATDTAQIILMDGTLHRLDRLFEIAGDFENNMGNNLKLSIIPGLICIGGVYLLHFGIPSGIAIYNLGLAAGVTNAMLPLKKYSESENNDDK